jgi:hypothetical protein
MAELTNGQKAAHNARTCGLSPLAPVLTEIYNLIDAQARRIADLELAEATRQARRKDKPLVATT